MTLTKQHLIDSAYRQSDSSRNQSTLLIESFLEIMKRTLESGEDILISGFGKFCVKDKNERRGRNPQTASDIVLGARRIVTFKCSGVLREKINGKG